MHFPARMEWVPLSARSVWREELDTLPTPASGLHEAAPRRTVNQRALHSFNYREARFVNDNSVATADPSPHTV